VPNRPVAPARKGRAYAVMQRADWVVLDTALQTSGNQMQSPCTRGSSGHA